MGANQASMVRRQRERERQLKRKEKQAQRAARREEKKAAAAERQNMSTPSDPKNDPMIDWDAAVRETDVEIEVDEGLQVLDVTEEDES